MFTTVKFLCHCLRSSENCPLFRSAGRLTGVTKLQWFLLWPPRVYWSRPPTCTGAKIVGNRYNCIQGYYRHQTHMRWFWAAHCYEKSIKSLNGLIGWPLMTFNGSTTIQTENLTIQFSPYWSLYIQPHWSSPTDWWEFFRAPFLKAGIFSLRRRKIPDSVWANNVLVRTLAGEDRWTNRTALDGQLWLTKPSN